MAVELTLVRGIAGTLVRSAASVYRICGARPLVRRAGSKARTRTRESVGSVG
jgi:hypothetical protein